jgi:nucleotide-binding universal stress UspA family protein
MFKTILAAIDASEQRHAVIAQAADIASRFGSVLHVVSVCDLGQHPQLLVADPIPETFTVLQTDVRELLREATRQLEEAGLSCWTHAPDGSAAEQILQLAGRIHSDLIVIGHRQLSWLRRLVEKSVGRDLVAEAPCSIMIVLQSREQEGSQRRRPAE